MSHIPQDNFDSAHVPDLNVDYGEIHRRLTELAKSLDGWRVSVAPSPLSVPLIGLDNVGEADSIFTVSNPTQVCILPVSESEFIALPCQLQPTSASITPNESTGKVEKVSTSWMVVVGGADIAEACKTPEPTLTGALERVRDICERIE
ncbi:hypothetical protein JCM17092_03100 [Haloplanus litoreus]